MIGTLRGIIREKLPPFLLLEVNGVGYEIQAPMITFYHLPDIEQSILLYTHLVIREDAHQLYGFHQQCDRDLFRELIKVNGVGPKLALSILSSIEPQQFIQAIVEQDCSGLVKVPGIGKKTAERLMIECRDVVGKWQNHPATNMPITSNQNIQDAISALTTLGYKPNDAKRVVEKIYSAGVKAEDLIRQALQHMLKGAH
jgi:Holliday junction DNA helicase RuvA